jgi:hypothetical protein
MAIAFLLQIVNPKYLLLLLMLSLCNDLAYSSWYISSAARICSIREGSSESTRENLFRPEKFLGGSGGLGPRCRTATAEEMYHDE